MKISKIIFWGRIFSILFGRAISTEPFIQFASQPSLNVHSKGHGFVLPKFKIIDRFVFELLDENSASNKGFDHFKLLQDIPGKAKD